MSILEYCMFMEWVPSSHRACTSRITRLYQSQQMHEWMNEWMRLLPCFIMKHVLINGLRMTTQPELEIKAVTDDARGNKRKKRMKGDSARVLLVSANLTSGVHWRWWENTMSCVPWQDLICRANRWTIWRRDCRWKSVIKDLTTEMDKEDGICDEGQSPADEVYCDIWWDLCHWYHSE